MDGMEVRVGNLRLFGDSAKVPTGVRETVERLESEGKTTMIVQSGRRFLGVIAFADRPRGKVTGALAQLRRLGVSNLIMLTGDNERVA